MHRCWVLVAALLLPLAAFSGESTMPHAYTNALIHEASPYLQQHAHNPVHWYPWGDEAFAKAKNEHKPIFLSIGYATCHWCHVMEHESFEDVEVAKLLNDSFIAIKVDREERPDIDQVYMQVAQMMHGSGGWPLNIIMTPEKKPFYAGTYIPKYSRGGHIGLMVLLPKVHALWQEKREQLEASAEQIRQMLQQQEPVLASTGDVDVYRLLQQASDEMNQSFDETHAGFGSAPKFPSPHKLLFLLRYAQQHGDKVSIQRVEATLDAMRAGGIFDQVGFGFHRYATDAAWLLPHFEKMLYDQAMLMLAYTEAYQITGHARHAQVVREIAAYVLRDMRDAKGGFYSAEDADSEGVEGKFYVWDTQELTQILGAADAEVAKQVFQMVDTGNFHDEATGQKTGDNIPHLAAWTEQGLSEQVDGIRRRLLAAREHRVRPFLDDKILTDWNGLMIAALAKAGRVLHEPAYVAAAKQSADFLLHSMQHEDGVLWHRYRHEQVGIRAHLDDYAFLTWGLIELYEANFDASYLADAMRLNHTMMDLFAAEDGGFYGTAKDGEALLVRPMEAWDGALPSGNAVAADNLLRLARMSGEMTLEDAAYRVLHRFAPLMQKAPMGLTHLLSAWRFAQAEGTEIVFAGSRTTAEGNAMQQAWNDVYAPDAVAVWRDDGSMKLIPFVQQQTPIHGKVTAYVCHHFQCNQPVTDVQAMLDAVHAK